MPQVFNRIYELVITNVETSKVFTPISPIDDLFIALAESDPLLIKTEVDVKSRVFKSVTDEERKKGNTSLRIKANIVSNNTDNNTNNATIQLYNISEQDQAFIAKSGAKYLSLRAGYQSLIDNTSVTEFDALPVIFSGDVITINSARDGADTITTITAKDSAASIRAGKVNRSFGKGQSKISVISSMVAAEWRGINLSSDSIGVTSSDFKKPNLTSNYTARGRVADNITDLIKDEDLIWYIVNGIFYLRKKSAPKLTKRITIRPENVINDLTPVLDNDASTKRKNGYNVLTFLNGTITTNTLIQLEGFDDSSINRQVDGDYAVRNVNHRLDNRGINNAWVTEFQIESSVVRTT